MDRGHDPSSPPSSIGTIRRSERWRDPFNSQNRHNHEPQEFSFQPSIDGTQHGERQALATMVPAAAPRCRPHGLGADPGPVRSVPVPAAMQHHLPEHEHGDRRDHRRSARPGRSRRLVACGAGRARRQGGALRVRHPERPGLGEPWIGEPVDRQHADSGQPDQRGLHLRTMLLRLRRRQGDHDQPQRDGRRCRRRLSRRQPDRQHRQLWRLRPPTWSTIPTTSGRDGTASGSWCTT